jgi:hypothetical protein
MRCRGAVFDRAPREIVLSEVVEAPTNQGARSSLVRWLTRALEDADVSFTDYTIETAASRLDE